MLKKLKAVNKLERKRFLLGVVLLVGLATLGFVGLARAAHHHAAHHQDRGADQHHLVADVHDCIGTLHLARLAEPSDAEPLMGPRTRELSAPPDLMRTRPQATTDWSMQYRWPRTGRRRPRRTGRRGPLCMATDRR